MKQLLKNYTLTSAVLLLIVSGAGAQSGQKSVARAFFSSLIVPGLGQHYAGSAGSVKYFVGAELLLAGLGVGHDQYAEWLEEDYRAFAAEHAGVSVQGKPKQYFVDIATYNSIFIYNEKMRIFDSRSVIPETEDNIWVWDSDESRLAFHFKRVDSDKYANRAVYFYTGLFVNHLVSGIHAAILAQRYNSRQPDGVIERINMRVIPKTSFANPGIRFAVSYAF